MIIVKFNAGFLYEGYLERKIFSLAGKNGRDFYLMRIHSWFLFIKNYR